MILGQPAPFVRAVVEAVDDASRAPHPSHAMAATQRAWLACCVTAVRGTNAMGWARLERASLGTDALAARSWLCRPRKMPWDTLLGARVRVSWRHHDIPSRHLVIDAPDNPRSQAAQALAPRDTRRAKDSGGSRWGHSLVWLGVVTPKLSIPVGVVFSQPAPALRAWDKQDKTRTQPGVPQKPRPPTPVSKPPDPPNAPLARRLRDAFKAHHAHLRVHGLMAEARSGTAPCVAAAAAMFGGVPVRSPSRSHQNLRVGKRDQHGADAGATQPGTPQPLRIRGGQALVATVGRARWSGCSHHTTRVRVAIHDNAEASDRDLIASDRSGRTLERVQGHTRRWRVEVLMQDGKSSDGWSPWTKPPGAEGARHRVILRLLVDHRLVVHPAQPAQRKTNLPAYTVGSLRAHGPVECLVHVIDDLVSSDTPQAKRKHFTHA